MKNDKREQANAAQSPDVAAESQAREAPGEEAPVYHDITIFCHPRNVSNLVQAFELEIKQAAGELPLSIIWSGTTSILHQGMILLQCQGKPPVAFLRNLSIDHEIFDFAVSDWVKSEETRESVKEEQDVQSQESMKAAGGRSHNVYTRFIFNHEKQGTGALFLH